MSQNKNKDTRYCYYCQKETDTKNEDCVVCGLSKTTPERLIRVTTTISDESVERLRKAWNVTVEGLRK